ncbi:hypothetical protein Hesp01_28800 [Herbidospora sp. NBRC 101105]|nr:hypothetical protein Hesp01_28800 [Herbidospora sp. NBRC 101105]
MKAGEEPGGRDLARPGRSFSERRLAITEAHRVVPTGPPNAPGESSDRPGAHVQCGKEPRVINHVRMTRLDDELGLDAIGEQLPDVVRLGRTEPDEQVEGLL